MKIMRNIYKQAINYSLKQRIVLPKGGIKMAEENKHEHKKSNIKIKKSAIWQIISGILGALLVISVFTGGFGFNKAIKGGLSAKQAADKAITFINDNMMQPGMKATLKGVEDKEGIYYMEMNIGGKDYESCVTKDGSLLFPTVIDLNAAAKQAESKDSATVEKTDRPKAELYIFSYCPAGSATLDSFAEAGKLLKNAADVKVKFFSNMHGEHEKQQNIIQECIQEVDSGKYWDYATQYLENVYKACASERGVECDKEKSTKLMNSAGIDSKKVFSCVDEKGEALYQNDKSDADALRLQYSPSIVINGVYLGDADRSPAGIKTLICSAFNNPPEECGETLSATGETASGGCS